jgi:hypothetical protein
MNSVALTGVLTEDPELREDGADPVRCRMWLALSYANVAATLALILALGGTSYAALRLPKNSVGRSQLRKSSVGTRALRNHGVHWSDIAPSARDSLRGQRGRPGPPGPPAARFFAAVNAGGEPVSGNATDASHTAVGSGTYTIGFAESVSKCVYSATLGSTDGAPVAAGRVAVTGVSGKVQVQTFDSAGVAADLPFHLIVAC